MLNASPAQILANLPPSDRAAVLAKLSAKERAEAVYCWPIWARPNQLLPKGEWTYWLLLAGRGFGKTRTGAETVRQWVRTCPLVSIIGPTAASARDVMVEGESGIMAICPDDERPTYLKSENKLKWPNGAQSLIFSADEPERLRGPQHHKIWADELAAWRYSEAWDQAKFGLRLGTSPQAVITTTPKPKRFITDIIADRRTVITRGSSYENRSNLAESFFADIIKKYEGTRLGRQELRAEVLTDTPGALWTRESIRHIPIREVPTLRRVVIGVDPPAKSTEGSDECGLIAAGEDDKGNAFVLADRSGVMSPREWGAEVVRMWREFEADVVVAEENQGGEMVELVIRTAEAENAARGVKINVQLVRATRGKYVRAEPISALYERGIVYHTELFEALEDQMCSFAPDFDRKESSPDRMDALVWALTELFPAMTQPVIQVPQRRMMVR